MAFAGIVKQLMTGQAPASRIIQPKEVKDFDVLLETEKKLESVVHHPPATENTIFRASQISGVCAREEVLRNLHNVVRTEKINAKTQRTFDFGNAFNDLVQNKWFGSWRWLVGDWTCNNCGAIYLNKIQPEKCVCTKDEGFTYRELFFEDKEAGVNGHTDGILELYQKRKLVELKTCNSTYFEIITKKRHSPFDKHEEQTQVYLWGFKITDAVIIYMNKDTSDWIQFPRVYDPSWVRRILQKPKEIREGIRTKTVPPRVVCGQADCARAKRCPVRKQCFEST